jgi:hypothetical protein
MTDKTIVSIIKNNFEMIEEKDKLKAFLAKAQQDQALQELEITFIKEKLKLIEDFALKKAELEKLTNMQTETIKNKTSSYNVEIKKTNSIIKDIKLTSPEIICKEMKIEVKDAPITLTKVISDSIQEKKKLWSEYESDSESDEDESGKEEITKDSLPVPKDSFLAVTKANLKVKDVKDLAQSLKMIDIVDKSIQHISEGVEQPESSQSLQSPQSKDYKDLTDQEKRTGMCVKQNCFKETCEHHHFNITLNGVDVCSFKWNTGTCRCSKPYYLDHSVHRSCSFGQKCNKKSTCGFFHSTEQYCSTVSAPVPKTLCRNNGKCQYGNKCHFLHTN